MFVNKESCQSSGAAMVLSVNFDLIGEDFF